MTSQYIVRIAVVAIALMAFTGWSMAAEHPAEHPEEGHADVSKAGINKEELADAIKDYVKKDSTLKGGYFLVYDKKAGESLALSLVKVHEDRLSSIGNNIHFACADFETPEGKVYDLDIFMKGHDKDHLAVTEVSVHKEAGVERYTWFEEGGVWKKNRMEGSHSKGSSAKGSAAKSEHPAEGSSSKGSGTKSEHPE